MRNTPVLTEEGEAFVPVQVFSLSVCVICACSCLPVEVEDVVKDLRVPVKEELLALDNVVVAQFQFLAVVCVCGEPADPCFGVPGS